MSTRTRTDLGGGAWVECVPRWWPDHRATMAAILDEVEVATIPVRVYGHTHPSTRFAANVGLAYRYSSAPLPAAAWTPTLSQVRQALGEELGVEYNECLVSYYPDGQAHVGYHRDPGTVPGSPIASVSLGGRRTFALRRHGGRRTWELGERSDGDGRDVPENMDARSAATCQRGAADEPDVSRPGRMTADEAAAVRTRC